MRILLRPDYDKGGRGRGDGGMLVRKKKNNNNKNEAMYK